MSYDGSTAVHLLGLQKKQNKVITDIAFASTYHFKQALAQSKQTRETQLVLFSLCSLLLSQAVTGDHICGMVFIMTIITFFIALLCPPRFSTTGQLSLVLSAAQPWSKRFKSCRSYLRVFSLLCVSAVLVHSFQLQVNPAMRANIAH